MAQIVPTVLAHTPTEYERMMGRASKLTKRVHVDIADGQFADSQTIGIAQVEAPADVQLDLHLMLQEPSVQLETALSLHPQLIIVHAESRGDVAGLLRHVQELGVAAGVGMLPETAVASVASLVREADHILLFTGHLGHNGGLFQGGQLEKIPELRRLKPSVEISVDGGVNPVNAADIARAGVDVLYTGSDLQEADNPKRAFAELVDAVTGVTQENAA